MIWAIWILAGLVPQDGTRAEAVVGEPLGGLRWRIEMRRVYSSLEPIPVEWSLENATGRDATAHYDEARGPRVRLTSRAGATREGAEKEFHGPAALYGTIHPQADSYAHRLDARDFRFMFGRLEPGKYGLQLVWPADGVRLEGEDPGPREIISPVFEFEIRKAEIDVAEKANVRDPRAELKLREPEPGKSARRADLVNRTDRDLVVAASKVTDYVKTWDSPRITWTSWVPGARWTRLEGSPHHFCGTGKSTITLKPGAALEMELDGPGDGIHRFEVECWPAAAPAEIFTVHSAAVLVDGFDAAYLRARQEKR